MEYLLEVCDTFLHPLEGVFRLMMCLASTQVLILLRTVYFLFEFLISHLLFLLKVSGKFTLLHLDIPLIGFLLRTHPGRSLPILFDVERSRKDDEHATLECGQD